jgi:uncharacterized membrane protein YgcG
MKQSKWLIIFLSILLLAALACGVDAGPPTSDQSVPSGDPPFPRFEGSWVIDTTGQISPETVQETNAILQKLRDDGIAEVVIVVINGVGEPEMYATRLGRHLKLGSTETDNGLVYLVRPDASNDQHLIYSMGRGLTAFTSGRVTDALREAAELANSGKYSEAVLSMAQGTDSVLRQQYEPRPETVTTDGDPSSEKELTPEQQKTVLVTILVIVVVWTLIGIGLMFVDVELGLHWILLGFRILLLIITAGKAGGGTGGSTNFGGRSGSR